MSRQLSLVFVNNSDMSGNVCLFQTHPEGETLPVAWFTEFVHPTTRAVFSWDPSDIGFIWSETGKLAPGISCGTSQFWKTDLSTDNVVDFTLKDGAYTFTDQRQGPTQGTMQINTDGTVAPGQASLGIGMAGAPTCLRQAMPNSAYFFTPRPEYWITFGNHSKGEVINIDTITEPARIDFQSGNTSMTAILNKDLTWTIKPTRDVNNAFSAALEKDENTLFGQHEV